MDEDFDSTCSTPFASAPSSPGRSPAIGFCGGDGYFFSAPASPIHLSSSASASAAPGTGRGGCAGDAEFEFGGPMISADKFFHNGQIRPFTLPPLPDLQPLDARSGAAGRGVLLSALPIQPITCRGA